jgi:hypothetical protein
MFACSALHSSTIHGSVKNSGRKIYHNPNISEQYRGALLWDEYTQPELSYDSAIVPPSCVRCGPQPRRLQSDSGIS